MLFKQKIKMKLCAMLIFAGSLSASAQYNTDYKEGEYADPQTIQSTVDIGSNEVLTVGTVKYYNGGILHDDIVLTRLNKDGKVLWNLRYGDYDHNEVGNGITLSWDRKHVIVVGSFGKVVDDGEPSVEREAIVLKVRISDGALVWTSIHGIDKYDEQAFLVERANDLEGEKTYVVVGTSTGDEEQSFERMYAFKVKDNGNEVWTNRYYLSYNFPYLSMRPTSMVDNKDGTFMVAGIRQEINRPSRLFTIGIKSGNGNVGHDLLYYDTNVIYHVGTCDIDKDPEGEGYALAFTALDFSGPCLAVDIDPISRETDRIGVMRLNNDRKVDWANVYWEKGATNHNGLTADIYKDEVRVCININRKERFNTPGILRLKYDNGFVIKCNIYHIPEYKTDYGPIGNSMIRSREGEYYVKSIYNDWGFSMVNPNIYGDAKCDKETEIRRCLFKIKPDEQKCEAKEYGKYLLIELPYEKADYGVDPCLGFIEGIAPESDEEKGNIDSPLNKATIYPSPVGESQDVINLKFVTELKDVQGNVKVFNSQGQEVFNYNLVFMPGENKMQFQAQQFAPGMYLVMISGEGEILDRVKFIKK